MTTVLAAVVTGVFALGVAWIANRPQRKELEETHRMVTVNHHSSRAQGKPDTVLDHLADLKDLVGAQGTLLSQHIRHSEFRDTANDTRFRRIEEHIYHD